MHDSDILRKNVMCQVERLMSELKDLEEERASMELDEYSASRQATLDQLAEFQSSLAQLDNGTVTLTDPVTAVRVAIQAAVTEAFHTADIIQLFARRQPDQLRQRLQQLSRDRQLGQLPQPVYHSQRMEILCALKRLGAALSAEEQLLLDQCCSDSQRHFVNAGDMT